MAEAGRRARAGRTPHYGALAVTVLCLCASLAAACGPPGAATACERFASPSGSDGAAGTLESPFATAKKLVGSLESGQAGCFRAGTYSFSTLEVNTPSITLAPYGTDAVTLRGDIKVLRGAAGAVIEGMKLDGAGGSNQIGPRIYADRVVLRDNEITNQHTGICVMLGQYYSNPAPRGVVIERNRIHDCGRLPATNHDHGIYLSEARETIIRDNWIYSNADRGVQQYPDTQGSLITGNVIDSNGQGVNFSGSDEGSCSNHNVVEGNVITNSELRWNAYSGSQGPACSGNLVRSNCVFASNPGYSEDGGIEPDSRSFNDSDNIIADPGFEAPAQGDYRLAAESPCLAKYTGTMSGAGAPRPPGLP
jgi:nitrous oxidase accessory protein NosD